MPTILLTNFLTVIIQTQRAHRNLTDINLVTLPVTKKDFIQITTYGKGSFLKYQIIVTITMFKVIMSTRYRQVSFMLIGKKTKRPTM